MAVGVYTEIKGDADEYDAVNAKMGVADDPPEGMIIHTAGEIEGGGMRLFDVWESAEAYEKFRNERLGPAVTEVVGPDARPTVQETYELHDFIRP
jgi:hypothetical protein